jgi:hypothetical protein
VHELGQRVGLPRSLAEIGLGEADLPRLAQESVGIKRLIDNNPRRSTRRPAERSSRRPGTGIRRVSPRRSRPERPTRATRRR